MPLKFNFFYLKNIIYQEVLHGLTLLLIFENLNTCLQETGRSKKCRLPEWFLLALLCQDLWGALGSAPVPHLSSHGMRGQSKDRQTCLFLLSVPDWRTVVLFISSRPSASYLLPASFQREFLLRISGFFSVYSL